MRYIGYGHSFSANLYDRNPKSDYPSYMSRQRLGFLCALK